MKIKIVLIYILTNLFLLNGKSQTTDSVLVKMLDIQYANYYGKPLDSLIAVLPSNYSQMKIFGIRNTARFLRILYPGKTFIELHVRDFNYMNPVDTNHTWNVNAIRKEKLYRVTVYKGSTCFLGCPLD
jgi:hypothetical protein